MNIWNQESTYHKQQGIQCLGSLRQDNACSFRSDINSAPRGHMWCPEEHKYTSWEKHETLVEVSYLGRLQLTSVPCLKSFLYFKRSRKSCFFSLLNRTFIKKTKTRRQYKTLRFPSHRLLCFLLLWQMKMWLTKLDLKNMPRHFVMDKQNDEDTLNLCRQHSVSV